MRLTPVFFSATALLMPVLQLARADANVMILDVPDYAWHAGCFGTASGNLMGYWDRNGFPDFYNGPTGGGVAPLNTIGTNAGIRSMWASRAGLDGRPLDQPGHIDDYWEDFDFAWTYESPAPDPYTLEGRPEHAPDCLGDFMGASQNKWTSLDGECSGNINAFGFNFWDKTGERRWNFTPAPQNGREVRDIQSGIRRWMEYRGTSGEVFSQLVDFNPETPEGKGFTFEDLKAEIDAGYPVILFLQNPGNFSRTVHGVPGMNPNVHAMVAFGYAETVGSYQAVQYRTSWASGDNYFSLWGPQPWEAGLALRGVIGVRPLPKIRQFERIGENLIVRWDGPSSTLYDNLNSVSDPVHLYVLEKSTAVEGPYEAVSTPGTSLETAVSDCCEGEAFFRVKLLPRGE